MGGEVKNPATEADRHRRPGGRAAEVVAAVHAATIQLLQEQGYERMEIPAIAERAGVNKTSIYRRWPGKAELVMDVVLERMRNEVPLPDTGSLLGDLTALMDAIAAVLTTPFAGGLLRALISHGEEGPAAQMRAHFWSERFNISGELLDRAVAKGELPESTDTRLLMEMAVAPLFFRALITGVATTQEEIAEIAVRVIVAFRVGNAGLHEEVV